MKVYAVTSADLYGGESGRTQLDGFELSPEPPDNKCTWRIVGACCNETRIFWTWERDS